MLEAYQDCRMPGAAVHLCSKIVWYASAHYVNSHFIWALLETNSASIAGLLTRFPIFLV